MEQNFQTSFIPKKPMVAERAATAQSVNLFLVLSILVLFATVVVSGGLYFYKGILEKNMARMEEDLALAKNRFEPSRISELQVLDKRLRASSEILSGHVALSPVLAALEEITMKTVRFYKFDFTLDEEDASRAVVKLNGVAVGYRSVALQSDIFTQNKYFINPIFSNLSLDNSGNVLFDLTFEIDPSFINYKNMVKRAESVPTDLPPASPETETPLETSAEAGDNL